MLKQRGLLLLRLPPPLSEKGNWRRKLGVFSPNSRTKGGGVGGETQQQALTNTIGTLWKSDSGAHPLVGFFSPFILQFAKHSAVRFAKKAQRRSLHIDVASTQQHAFVCAIKNLKRKHFLILIYLVMAVEGNLQVSWWCTQLLCLP